MRLNTPEIAWHGKEPIFSVDFSKIGSSCRLASAGADKDVKVGGDRNLSSFVGDFVDVSFSRNSCSC